MKLDKIQEQLKDLTPQQKLDLLKPLLEKEKNKKNKEQLQFFIKKVEEEKTLLEEEIERLETRSRREEETEEPLETLVEEATEETQQPKQKTKPLELYQPSKEKSKPLYETANVPKNIDYMPKDKKEQPETLNVDRFTQDTTLNESKKLEKEKKKYETGVV